MKNHLPATINLHKLIPCNYTCGFCYAGFASAKRSRIPQSELHEIIQQIATAPKTAALERRKVTFAGGEPLLSRTLLADIEYAHSRGLVTSLVTNGSLLTREIIRQLGSCLDWLTISIDSLDPNTNLRIGRARRGVTLSAADYLDKIETARRAKIRVKINTVVNRANVGEDFNKFMRSALPFRWKMFQVTRIAEENGLDFGSWSISLSEFTAFLSRHEGLHKDGITLVPETQADMYGTYAMVGPNGCFFDNSQGTYLYSKPIIAVGIEAAFEEISFSLERFRERNGDYDFVTGHNRQEESV